MNADALIGAVLGTCTLEKLLGEGSTGAIFLAQQSRPNRQVAVKVLLSMQSLTAQQHTSFLEHVEREIETIVALNHPNIMLIYEYGEHNGLIYLVMPYIHSGTLHDELERDKPLPLPKVALYLEQIATGLAYAHTRNIIHCNIKPTNILLQPDGQPLLTDFGLTTFAMTSDPAIRTLKSASPLQSLDYMAPEQVAGNSIGIYTDIYALGVTLYHMVTGSLPFSNSTVSRLQILLQAPGEARPDLPAAAEQVILKSLARQPEDRYADVQELAHAFRQALTNSAISSMHAPAITATSTDPHLPAASSTNLAGQIPPITDNVAHEEQTTNQIAIEKPRTSGIKNDIIARTSMTLPSMSGFASAPHAPTAAMLETPSTTPAQPESLAQIAIPPTNRQKLVLRSAPADTDTQPSSPTMTTKAFSPPAPSKQPESASETLPAVQPQTIRTGKRTRTPARGLRLLFLLFTAVLILLVVAAFLYISPAFLTAKGGTDPTPVNTTVQHNSHSGNGGATNANTNGNANNSTQNTGSASRSFQLGTNPLLVIKGHNSNVNIQTDTTGIVTVTPKQHGSNVALDANNANTIIYNQSSSIAGQQQISIATGPAFSDVDYDITIPAKAQVQITVDSGSIAIDGGNGATVDTGNGNIDIADIQGSVHIHTANGNITAHNITGQLAMEAGSGSIHATNTSGQMKAVIQDGDIVIRGAALGDQSALKTTNGSVYFTGTLDPNGSSTMEANRGNVILTLPGNAAFQLNAHIDSGNVQNEFGGNIIGSTPRAIITITVSSGNATLSKAV